ncbi:PaREP1 family protein [Pyrolobus fumarii 1A]|uniref:PaREP1 family protein n=1 Tax=Pyrolobus fumarii (strain DSM 11204 / 1A) TaxID=694429 RepID=G0EHC4_PYRF1|nr:PaREP1 family protein [Pyrolobus fumarii]AEM38499.1 PaREP1 family protein [Pyrolobus fumarii 1A]
MPKLRLTRWGYASGRVLEALLEALLALSFLDMGYTRNAAGKAFQAWKALTAAILALEKDRLEKLLSEKERKWLETKGVPWVPTSSLKPLSQLLEEKVGYKYFSFYTDKALDLHTYQYQGPDPERLLSKHASREEAATDTLLLLKVLIELIEEKVKPRLQQRNLWLPDHEKALQQLKQKLTPGKQQA